MILNKISSKQPDQIGRVWIYQCGLSKEHLLFQINKNYFEIIKLILKTNFISYLCKKKEWNVYVSVNIVFTEI